MLAYSDDDHDDNVISQFLFGCLILGRLCFQVAAGNTTYGRSL